MANLSRPRLSGAFFAILLAGAFLALPTQAQEGSTIPPDLRGSETSRARGILDGNQIETNYRNHGAFAYPDEGSTGFWPRGVGWRRHVDGIALYVSGIVKGERAKWPQFYGENARDTTITPVIVHHRSSGTRLGPYGDIWGWLPLPGFHNLNRINPVTGEREPNPALSDDPTSWPEFWPDRMNEPTDPGWPGVWNGWFGKGVRNADLESFYVMDDHSDKNYLIDQRVGRPYSEYGVFYPDPSDSTMGGFGLQVEVRIFQWGNVLAEDTMFLIYRISNVGATHHEELYFAESMNIGLGSEQLDENAAFDPILDMSYAWDADGIGITPAGSSYPLGHTGIAFLESPVRRGDGLDNDTDGITDEDRFSGPGTLIEGQEAIRQYVQTNYDLARFEAFNGPLEERPAFEAGYWWTGDENMDWLRYTDKNENGVWDSGEKINNDLGRDGIGPNEWTYEGPDVGEADGVPTIGEGNFDETDIDEGDQIGLTGFMMSDRPLWQSNNNMSDDQWVWDRLVEAEANIQLGDERQQTHQAGQDQIMFFTSGTVSLAPQQTDFFSTAWVFGWDFDDFLRNRRVVQTIYNADYQFAQPPIAPTLTAEAGDGYVVLSWDTLSLVSFDRFAQEFDFEGYKLYRGTDVMLSDSRVISDASGTPTFYKPIAQWDLDNGITGRTQVLDDNAVFDLGEDTGLQFSYIDDDVTNGKTYYYAVVAYDRGFTPDDPDSDPIDPQENVFRVAVDAGGQIRSVSGNAAVVTPRPDAAGYVRASTNEDLRRPHGTLHPDRTEPVGTGSIEVSVVDSRQVPEDAVYRISFFDTTESNLSRTIGYQFENVTSGATLIDRRGMSASTPVAQGIVVDIYNDPPELDPLRSGWRGEDEDGDVLYSRNPLDLSGYSTNWMVDVNTDESDFSVLTNNEYRLVWSDPADSVYTAPRFTGGYIEADIPIFCENVTTGESCELLVLDVNESEAFDAGDELVVNEKQGRFGPRQFRFRVGVSVPQGEQSIAPRAGAILEINQTQPFATGDYFQFTVRESFVDEEMAKAELEDIAVVPNPYITAVEWEERTAITGRGPRKLQFINLPERCTIRIFTVRGELVDTIEHQGTGGDGAAWWNLRTKDDQEVAYGMYLYHVDAPGIGEATGKFAVVK